MNEDPKHSQAEEDAHSNAIWMISFADMVSLLLAFFMLMYATGSIKKSQWQEMHASLQNQFNPRGISFFSDHTTKLGVSTAPSVVSRESVNYVHGLWSHTIESIPALQKNVALHLDGDDVILSIANDVMFEPRDVVFAENASQTVKALGQVLYRMGAVIEIWVSTDPSEFADKQTPRESPWKNPQELSLARAMHVASLLHMYNDVVTFAVYGNNRSLLSRDPKKQDAPVLVAPVGTINLVIRKER